MTDKRNNKDWTDALRERLDTSALSPSSDIWSKVESQSRLAVKEHKTDRKPVFVWTAVFCAVAAALALFIIPDSFRTVPTVNPGLVAEEEPVSVVPATDLNEEIDIQTEEQILVAETALPVKRTAAPPQQAVVYDENPVAVETPVTETSNQPADEVAKPVVKEQAYDFFNEPAAMPKRRMRLTLSVAGVSGATGTGSGSGTAVNGGHNSSTGSPSGGDSFASSEESGKTTKATVPEPYAAPSFLHHHRPVSIGLALTYPFDDRWFFESGLNYSYLRTDINSDPRGQRLHFLGVPIKLGFVLGASSHFSVTLSAGAMAEKLIYGETSGKEITIKEPQFSAVASSAVQYRIGNGLHLFLAPEFSYYLTETDVQSFHTEHPASLTLRLGVNVSLGSK